MSSSATQSTAEKLEELLLAWEEVYEQGQNLPAEELCADCPELIEPLQERINVLLKMEARFGTSGTMAPLDSTPSEDFGDRRSDAPQLVGRVVLETDFKIGPMHAAGGLGEIYLAHDADLQRDVAIKTLKAICKKFPDRRARFLREARITGQLEHPGIVPVYGLGTAPDGQPLYAMRFIRGESLDEQIRAVHDRGTRATELRRLLRHLVSACRTVHYAHSRRVLHCDIKPLNIMIGKFGETFVLDWGEALVVNPQTLATEGPVPAASEVDEQTDSPGGGTVPYMPPERLDGSGTPLDATSDVYALGATLYKVLTGRDAFRATSRQQLLDKILKGDYIPADELQPGISRALAAIAAKAMSLRQCDRYKSAGALADDIQAWMDDEPVSCLHEGWGDWLSRMSRRYRAAALATLLTLLAIVAATSLLAVMSTRNARQRSQDLEALQAAHAMTEVARQSGLKALARYAAMQFERDTEATWKMMEQSALNPQLSEWCQTAKRTDAPCPELQAWLEKLYSRHREDLGGSSWFVLDAEGDQVGRFPEGRLAQEGIRNFAHKSYFHGELTEYPEGTHRQPLTAPSISTVFWSSSDNCRKIAYSVPIPSADPLQPVGVLVMTVKLGNVRMLDIDVDGRVDRQAALVDLRADWLDRIGTILQHPGFREEKFHPDQAPLVSAEVIERLRAMLPVSGSRKEPEVCPEYFDPILKQGRLAVIEPVRGRNGGTTGLFVVVTEPRNLVETAAGP